MPTSQSLMEEALDRSSRNVGAREVCKEAQYVTVHAKTYRKSAKNIFEIRADFVSTIYILDFLQNSCG